LAYPAIGSKAERDGEAWERRITLVKRDADADADAGCGVGLSLGVRAVE
jgi:hypothetical protein